MPLPIDTRTLCLASGMSILSLSVAMTYVWRQRKTYPGFGAWLASAWCSFAGMGLLSLRDFAHDALSLHLANVALYLCTILVVVGLGAFTDQRVVLGRYLALLVAVLALNTVFAHLTPSLKLRVALFSFTTGGLCLRAAVLAWRGLPAVLGQPNRLVQVTLLTLAFVYLARGIGILAFPPASEHFMAPSLLQAMALLGYLLGHAMLYTGLIVLNGQRVERDLHASMEEYRRLRGLIPICAGCKKIRDEQGIWDPLETYLHQHAGVDFTHGLCPDCAAAFRKG